MRIRWGPTTKCKRCYLAFMPEVYDKCPHCSNLGDAELQTLFSRREEESVTNASLGRKMIIAAVALAAVALLVFNA